jgi:polyphenol oxidase
VKRSASLSKKSRQEDLRRIDERFRVAGLVRSMHNDRAFEARRSGAPKLDQATQSELCQPATEPMIAWNGVAMLRVESWRNLGWLWHGFSTRIGGTSNAYCAAGTAGELNLGFTAEDSFDAVVENRYRLAEAICGSRATPLVVLRQFHSNLTLVASRRDVGRIRPSRADGLMTREPGLLLSIQTADCIPVLVADRRRRAVAAFHAGWRGTVQRIVELGIGRMRLEFGSEPVDLVAAIGPGISACCFAVGQEVLDSFESQFGYARELFHEVYDSQSVRTKYPMLFLAQRAPGHSSVDPQLHVDLTEANRRQLLCAGLSPEHISVVKGCTKCRQDLFFSHRGAHGHTGRMMSVIGICPE